MVQRRSATCRHGYVVCSQCIEVTDAARRMADYINVKVVSQPWDAICNGWLAIRLADGSCDGVLYDTRQDAIRHQLHEQLCAYFCMRNALGGANPRDCQIYLNIHRHAYDNGGRLAEPEAPSFIMSVRGHDIMTGRVDRNAKN